MNQTNQNNNQKEFEVRDLRQKEQYITDDKFLNGYVKFLGIYAVGVYGSLCRHANKEQRCWPSIKKMCEELGVGKDSVINAIKRMEFWKIVKKHRIGKMVNNRYDLINKRYWLSINEKNLKKYSETCNIEFTRLLHRLHLSAIQTSNSKETHIKELKERKVSFFKKKKKRPTFHGMEMRHAQGKWWCIPEEGGQWLEYTGKEDEIKWK